MRAGAGARGGERRAPRARTRRPWGGGAAFWWEGRGVLLERRSVWGRSSLANAPIDLRCAPGLDLRVTRAGEQKLTPAASPCLTPDPADGRARDFPCRGPRVSQRPGNRAARARRRPRPTPRVLRRFGLSTACSSVVLGRQDPRGIFERCKFLSREPPASETGGVRPTGLGSSSPPGIRSVFRCRSHRATRSGGNLPSGGRAPPSSW